MIFRRYKKPKIGDTREVKRFAWWPRSLGDDYIIWLGFYMIYQRYDPWPGQPDWREFTSEEYKNCSRHWISLNE